MRTVRRSMRFSYDSPLTTRCTKMPGVWTWSGSSAPTSTISSTSAIVVLPAVAKYSPKKETRDFDGRPYVLEPAIRGDYALVKAWKGDRFGNLVYRHTAMNFNPMMATAAKVTVAEVEELVEVGELDPDHIHTAGIYVSRIFAGTGYEKRIERRTTRKPS